MVHEKTPDFGYLIPDWQTGPCYRATAVAYLKQTGADFVQHTDREKYTLPELFRDTAGYQKYSWEWAADRNGVIIASGCMHMTEGEFFDQYGTTNLPRMIERWNNDQVKKSPDGLEYITWTYRQIL